MKIVNMKSLKSFFLILFIFISLFIFAENEKKASAENDWVIAVSEFKDENLENERKIYAKIVSQMFLIYLDTNAKRLVPFAEKKMRAVLQARDKRFKLIKERAKLIKERDDIFLSVDSEDAKNKKKKAITKKIKEIDDKIYYAGIDVTVEKNKFFTSSKPKDVKLWKNGDGLYKYPENKNLAQALKKDNISALLSGVVKDISGYMLIKVKLDTGLEGVPVYEFYEAGPYDAIENLVYSLSLQIYSAIQNTKAVKVFFDVSPKDTKLYIDNRKIDDFSKPIILYEGLYQISASAENYAESSKKIELKDKKAYKLKIDLKKLDTSQIGFDLKSINADIFYKSQYSFSMPGMLNIPRTKSILEFENNSSDKKTHTFALFDSYKIGSQDYIQNMIVELNRKNVKESIERQRKIMYWSLGALYISLPFTMITKSRLQDKINSSQLDNIKLHKALSYTFQGISIGLGINYLVQLILYFIKADKALPREIKVNSNKPKFKKLPIKTVIKNDSKKNKKETKENKGNKNE